MSPAIPLAVAAGLCTAASTTCQRAGALRGSVDDQIDAGLLLRLVRQPVWLLGVASMVVGFVLQATALHFGSLALVQPILASELLFVFIYLAIANPRLVRRRDGLSAVGMAVGLGAVLFTADPSGGRQVAPSGRWALAGMAGFVVVGALVLVARGQAGRSPSAPRRAAFLGAAAGVCWGLLAGVIKQLGSVLAAGGVVAMLTSWPVYALVVVGLASMTLASNALRAGPLAASQPGFTIVDPLVAATVGVLLFGERVQAGPGHLDVEVAALAVLGLGAWGLSRSALVAGDPGAGVLAGTSGEPSGGLPTGAQRPAERDRSVGREPPVGHPGPGGPRGTGSGGTAGSGSGGVGLGPGTLLGRRRPGLGAQVGRGRPGRARPGPARRPGPRLAGAAEAAARPTDVGAQRRTAARRGRGPRR